MASVSVLPRITWVRNIYCPDVLLIDSACYPDPMPAEELKVFVQEQTCRVALVVGKVVGSICYSLFQRHSVVYRLSVHPDFRRCGVGTALALNLLERLPSTSRTHALVAVHERQVAGQMFLKKLGFFWQQTSRGAAADGEDMYVFRHDI